MTTPPLICRRCGSFGPTMADLANICEGHVPVVDRMPAVVRALDASGQVLASFFPPAGTVRLGYEPMPVARSEILCQAPGGTSVDVRELLVQPVCAPLSHEDTAITFLRPRRGAAGPQESIPGRPFEPFVTTPPAPAEETLAFQLTMPDKPAPWGPLKIQFQALDCAGNVLASVPAGEQLHPPPGAVGFRYLIDRVEGGDELVVSPSVGFRPAPGIVAEPRDVPDATANLLIPGVPMTLPTSAAYLRGRFALEFHGADGAPCGMAEVPSGAVTVSITYLDGEPEEDEGAPPPSPEHGPNLVAPLHTAGEARCTRCGESAATLVGVLAACQCWPPAATALAVPLEGLATLELRLTSSTHEGRLLFHGADGELLEAAPDGVPHAVPVGTDHVRLSVRRKA